MWQKCPQILQEVWEDIQKAADHNNEIADLLDTEVKRFKLE
mgnify:CR=1 FL=1